MAMRLVRSMRNSSALQLAPSIAPSPCSTSTLPRATLWSPLTARRIVDLREPDRHTSTQISPFSIVRLTPAAPSTAPVAAMISSRVLPASISASASRMRLPNTMSRFSKMTAGISGARLSLGTTADPVEHDRQQHDRHSSLEAHRNIDLAESAHDRRAEALGADQSRDDDHGKAQHDALRDARHNGRQRIGHFDLPE